MWVNTALSCRICHIMPSRICHSFFMPSQGAIFVSTCILSAGKCYGNYLHKNVERRRQYKWQCKIPQIHKNKTGAGRRRRAFHHDSRLVATLIDDCHTESNRLESWNTNKKKNWHHCRSLDILSAAKLLKFSFFFTFMFFYHFRFLFYDFRLLAW